MHSYVKKIFAMVLSCVMAFGVFVCRAGVNAVAKPSYYYKLLYDAGNSTDQDETASDKIVTLQLYVMKETPGSPNLDGGSFGLRFPLRIGGDKMSFRVDEKNIMLGPYDADGGDEVIGDTYHAFSWTALSSEEYEFSTSTEPKGFRMHLGTYTFHVGSEPPNKSSVGLLNWFNIKEAIPDWTPDNPTQDPALDPFNQDIWYDSDEDGVYWYQGFYLDSETGGTATDKQDADKVDLTRTDIRLEWKAPEHWPNAATILSYDPKKLTTATLYDSEGNLIQRERLDTWKTADTADIYSAFGVGEAGTGLYYQALDLNRFNNVEPGKTYKLILTKPGHIPVEIPELIAGSSILGDAQNIPEEEIYMPCGDIGYSGSAAEGTPLFGDGAIKLGDRSALMGFLNRAIPAADVQKPVAGSDDPEDLKAPTNPAYYADLNGDGVITLKDLSILMSPNNYNRVTTATILSN